MTLNELKHTSANLKYAGAVKDIVNAKQVSDIPMFLHSVFLLLQAPEIVN